LVYFHEIQQGGCAFEDDISALISNPIAAAIFK
jgi:hypothetical protein